MDSLFSAAAVKQWHDSETPSIETASHSKLTHMVEWYNKGGRPNPHLSDKVKKLNLTDQEKQDLVEFMKACTGPFPRVETGRLP